jgi:hypothetical protein
MAMAHDKGSACKNERSVSVVEFGDQLVSREGQAGVEVGEVRSTEVRFNYYHGGGNRIRIAGMTYPNGRDLTYDYGVADGMNDACSRIESIINDSDSLNLATYQYLGTSGFVRWSTGFSLLRFARDLPYDRNIDHQLTFRL